MVLQVFPRYKCEPRGFLYEHEIPGVRPDYKYKSCYFLDVLWAAGLSVQSATTTL